jgi:hypothetical protein
MRVDELTGAMLDLWVARAEGKCYTMQPGVWGMACINELGRCSIAANRWDCARYFEPSKNWGHGGPIIERVAIGVHPYGANWRATAGGCSVIGPTALVAAMRAYVTSMFGEEVADKVAATSAALVEPA